MNTLFDDKVYNLILNTGTVDQQHERTKSKVQYNQSVIVNVGSTWHTILEKQD